MAKYRVSWQQVVFYVADVEAENEEEAIDEARNLPLTESRNYGEDIPDTLDVIELPEIGPVDGSTLTRNGNPV